MKNLSKILIEEIEKNFINNEFIINTGDFINLAYKTKINEKERPLSISGIIISIKNKGINKSFTIRQIKKGYFIDQKFFLHSPKIEKIEKKTTLNKRKSKLYYLKSL